MITLKEIEKLASLSRLRLTEEEKVTFQKEIDPILSYVGQIKELTGEEGDRGIGEVRNIFREDAEPHSGGEFTETLLQNAPEKEGQYFKTKKIL